MAKVSPDSIAWGWRGAAGSVVFRQYNGETVVSARPAPSKYESTLQKHFRNRFKEATVYAKICMRDGSRKAAYGRKAKKMKVPNAYTVALTEYLRMTKIEKVDLYKFKGRAGDKITITTTKKGFSLQSVDVALLHASGESVHSGSATRSGGIQWVYKMPVTVAGYDRVVVTVKDYAGQETKTVIPLL